MKSFDEILKEETFSKLNSNQRQTKRLYEDQINFLKYSINLGLTKEDLKFHLMDFSEKLNESDLKEEKPYGSFVGLFWFTEDYSKIIDICGIQEFTFEDILSKRSVSPIKGHVDIERGISVNNTPRGRVSLFDGVIYIGVGTDCPDEALYNIINSFNLGNYFTSNKVRVIKDSHWNEG